MTVGVKLVVAIVIILGISGVVLYCINENNKKYEVTTIENHKYYLLKQDNKFGIIDANGNTLINPKYTEIRIPNPQKPVFFCKQ